MHLVKHANSGQDSKLPSQLLALNSLLGRCYISSDMPLMSKCRKSFISCSLLQSLVSSSMYDVDSIVRFSKLRNYLITSFPQPHQRSKFRLSEDSNKCAGSVTLISISANDLLHSRCCSKRPAGASSISSLIAEMTVSKTTMRISREIPSTINHYSQELLRTLPREHHGSRKGRRPTSSHFEEPAAVQQQEVVHYRQ